MPRPKTQSLTVYQHLQADLLKLYGPPKSVKERKREQMAAKCAADKTAKKAEQAKKVPGARILHDEHGVEVGVAVPHGLDYDDTCGGHFERLSPVSSMANPQIKRQALQNASQAQGTRRLDATKYNLKRRELAGRLDNDFEDICPQIWGRTTGRATVAVEPGRMHQQPSMSNGVQPHSTPGVQTQAAANTKVDPKKWACQHHKKVDKLILAFIGESKVSKKRKKISPPKQSELVKLKHQSSSVLDKDRPLASIKPVHPVHPEYQTSAIVANNMKISPPKLLSPEKPQQQTPIVLEKDCPLNSIESANPKHDNQGPLAPLLMPKPTRTKEQIRREIHFHLNKWQMKAGHGRHTWSAKPSPLSSRSTSPQKRMWSTPRAEAAARTLCEMSALRGAKIDEGGREPFLPRKLLHGQRMKL